MAHNYYPRIGWTRSLSNGFYTFINDETGTKFDADGLDHWGYNKDGFDVRGCTVDGYYCEFYDNSI